MNPKKKVRQILEYLKKPSERNLESFDEIDVEIRKLTKNVQKKVNAKSLENVNSEIEKFRKSLDLEPVLTALESLKGDTGGIYKELATRIETELSNLVSQLQGGIESLNAKDERVESLSGEFGSYQQATAEEIKRVLQGTDSVRGDMQKAEETLRKMIADIEVSLGKALFNAQESNTEAIKEITELKKALEEFRRDFLTKLANVGGNANRNIAISGNTSVLSSFTDINLKPGSGIALTYTPNATTKYTDVTITATGGGDGITREINRISVSSTIGSVAGIDYVTICTAGVQTTLPTAVNNDNLYTVKNVSASSVLVGTTGGQTIDGDSTIILATQYTSVDIINDGNDNWSIT